MNGFRVLVCGSRNWEDQRIVDWVLDGAVWADVNFTLIEGGAKGADACAAAWARNQDVSHQTFAADWKTHGKAAGPIRNQEMIDIGQPDVVVAFTDDLEHSKGTKDCVRRAKKHGVPVYVVSRA